MRKIEFSGKQLLALINDILELSRLESGRSNLDRRPFDLRQCVEDVTAVFHDMAREEGRAFSVRLEVTDAMEQGHLVGKRVLLAEDNALNMEIAVAILTMNGLEVIQAKNGAEAVEMFRQSLPHTIHAILMDMQMPVMDGCTAARAIRAMDRPDAASVPIIAVTANAFAEDIAKTTEAGMDGHISKPIDFAVLSRTLPHLVKGWDRASNPREDLTFPVGEHKMNHRQNFRKRIEIYGTGQKAGGADHRYGGGLCPVVYRRVQEGGAH